MNSFLNQKILYPILDYDYCLKEKLNIFDVLKSWEKFPSLFSFFQFRAKSLIEEDYKKIYSELKKKSSIPIIINDYFEIAISENSFGLHLGKEDCTALSKKNKSDLKKSKIQIKGTSSHSILDLSELDFSFWDYSGFGPMNESKSKISDYKILTLQELILAIEKYEIRLVPIGGINLGNFKNYFFKNKTVPAMISGLNDKKIISNLLDFL